MKIAVFSDTHGTVGGMLRAVRDYHPDKIIHLGDGYSDTFKLDKEFPDIPVYCVSGNCDGDCAPDTLTLKLGCVTALLTHGHRYGVRYKSDTLLYAAEAEGAQIAMFGHTHRAGFEQFGGIYLLNPGTAGVGGDRTWAKLEIDENGSISCSIEKIVLS